MLTKPITDPLVKVGRMAASVSGPAMVYWGVDGSLVKVSEVKTLPASLVNDELFAEGWFRVGCYVCAVRQLTALKAVWRASEQRMSQYPTELLHALQRKHPSRSIVC